MPESVRGERALPSGAVEPARQERRSLFAFRHYRRGSVIVASLGSDRAIYDVTHLSFSKAAARLLFRSLRRRRAVRRSRARVGTLHHRYAHGAGRGVLRFARTSGDLPDGETAPPATDPRAGSPQSKAHGRLGAARTGESST